MLTIYEGYSNKSQIVMIPLTVLSVFREYLNTNILSGILTVHSVANYGLGKDIWTVSFDNITSILKVDNIEDPVSYRID